MSEIDDFQKLVERVAKARVAREEAYEAYQAADDVLMDCAREQQQAELELGKFTELRIGNVAATLAPPPHK